MWQQDITEAFTTDHHFEQEGFVLWSGQGLPNDLFPLLSAEYTAFVHEGKEVVTHGGASIEEVLVPFIVFRQGTKYRS